MIIKGICWITEHSIMCPYIVFSCPYSLLDSERDNDSEDDMMDMKIGICWIIDHSIKSSNIVSCYLYSLPFLEWREIGRAPGSTPSWCASGFVHLYSWP
jgi:hypothetical protein